MSDAESPADSETDHEHHDREHVGPGYATPQAAIEEADRERLAYVMGLHVGTDVDAPDFVAVVDLDPESETYQEIIDRVQMPNRGDELHHFGWNACSSSCHAEGLERSHLVVPGQRSSRIHVIDATDRREPEIQTVIEPEEVFEYDLSAPHTVHCVPGGNIVISMLGDADGDLPGGFLELGEDFEIKGRWEADRGEMEMNYDYWYQPRHNVMVSTEWAAPKTYYPGFDLADVEEGNYGRRLHIWDWEDRSHETTLDLGEEGQIPLEVRFLHSPESTHGYVGAALSSNIFHFSEEGETQSVSEEASGDEPRAQGGEWTAEKAIDFEAREHPDWEMPVPPLVTDILVSMDDRYLYGSNWLHGEVWMYDISDPANPRKADSISLGGLFGERQSLNGRDLVAGPQMLQLSLDGRRLYWTSSLFSSWDNQFFPEEGEQGSVMLKADVDPRNGTMTLDESFMVDFGDLPEGPARAHEIRWPGGDCTSDVWQ